MRLILVCQFLLQWKIINYEKFIIADAAQRSVTVLHNSNSVAVHTVMIILLKKVWSDCMYIYVEPFLQLNPSDLVNRSCAVTQYRMAPLPSDKLQFLLMRKYRSRYTLPYSPGFFSWIPGDRCSLCMHIFVQRNCSFVCIKTCSADSQTNKALIYLCTPFFSSASYFIYLGVFCIICIWMFCM